MALFEFLRAKQPGNPTYPNQVVHDRDIGPFRGIEAQSIDRNGDSYDSSIGQQVDTDGGHETVRLGVYTTAMNIDRWYVKGNPRKIFENEDSSKDY